MKKFLFALIVSLLVTATSHAAIETYVGEGSATMSEAETQDVAVDRAKLKALRHAQEQAGVYIRSQSRMRDLELVDDEVEMLTGGIVKIMNTNVKKTVINDEVIQVFVTVTVQINSDDLQREIDKLLSKRNPKPPVDRPKPIEQPAPQPVDKPKPEKVEPPTEKIEQPAEEPAPVEEPKPAEPITPPPVDEPTQTDEPAPRGEIKFFEFSSNGAYEQEAIENVKNKMQKQTVAFVMEYCAKQNLNITEDEALAAVDYSSKVVNFRYGKRDGVRRGLGYSASAKVLLYVGKLDAWIDKNLRR